MYIKTTTQKSLFKLKIRSRKYGMLPALNTMILNVEHKPKASHSQITVLSRPIDMELSELLVRDS